jgi:uncharacterized membrane protein
MASPELRPLSLGEILDRTFSIYRQNFLLFIGLASIAQVFVLARDLLKSLSDSGVLQFPAGLPTSTHSADVVSPAILAVVVLVAIPLVVLYIAASVYVSGGMYFAVSEIYMGRKTTIGASLRRMRGRAITLFVVNFLNGLAILVGLIVLVIPGIYVGCRLSVCSPVVLYEDVGPSDALSRSFRLTSDAAWRAFVIFLLFLVLLFVSILLFEFPFNMLAGFATKGSLTALLATELAHVGDSIATVLVTPYLPIATAIFYYDLRVKKEAFDLQVIMNPDNPAPPPTPDAPLSLA